MGYIDDIIRLYLKGRRPYNHRIPPPAQLLCELYWKHQKQRPRPGYCQLCDALIPKRDGTPHLGRSWCDGDCRMKVNMAWWQMNLPSKEVFARDGWCCVKCGYKHDPQKYPIDIEDDHIIPLALAPWEPYYWSLANRQTLCIPCHRAKTIEDMKAIRARSKTGPLQLPVADDAANHRTQD